MQNPSDDIWMMRACDLAYKGAGHTRPNPQVGAVLVKEGYILGEGWHRRAGGDHAEVAAIKDAQQKGYDVRGATLYVTLEPCSKPGLVDACTDAIIDAEIKHVVFGTLDPNPKNRGCAKRILKSAGVSCQQIKSAALQEACEQVIAPFAKLITTGLPFVTVKIAMSLDGRICDNEGNAKWISSAEAREETGVLREQVDAIMVGAETIRKDNPSLLSHGKPNKDLIRLVVTRSGHIPPDAQVLTDGKNETRICQVTGTLREMMLQLGADGITHILCEGGLQLARSLADEGLVDEWLTVLSPCIIGNRPLASKTKCRLDTYGPVDGADDIIMKCAVR